jgi:LPXTG-motif cell wall-anchored protein
VIAPVIRTGRRRIVDRRSIALKVPIAGIAAGVGLVMFAGAASAHSADAAVQRECSRSTMATVTITNEFNLDAVVSFSGAASGSSAMPANGTTAVSFSLNDPAMLNYSVTWSDGFKQGQRSISVDPLTDCVITPPTTTPPEATTAPPPTEAPTTVPPAAETVPPTTVAEATTSPTVLGVELRPETAAAPKAAPRAAAPAQLPATGSNDAVPLVAIGASILAAGVILVAVRRVPRSS